jgi:hypothetical protein
MRESGISEEAIHSVERHYFPPAVVDGAPEEGWQWFHEAVLAVDGGSPAQKDHGNEESVCLTLRTDEETIRCEVRLAAAVIPAVRAALRVTKGSVRVELGGEAIIEVSLPPWLMDPVDPKSIITIYGQNS